MADPRHRLGAQAEEAVAVWLAACGWRVLARRHRSPGGGEVDLVLLDPASTLVGVEVRARRSLRAGSAAESVDRRRAARIARTLAAFAVASDVGHRGLRVDLVAVEPMPAPPPGRWHLRRVAGIGSW